VAGGLAGPGALRAPARPAGAGKPPLGLQLWSVRDQLKKDLSGTLRQIRSWGIAEVESFGPFGAEIAGELKDAGLRCRAMHVGHDRLTQDLAGALRDADVLGASTIVNPSLPHARGPQATRQEILQAAERFARWAKECRTAGKRFAYHTHGQEFGRAPEGSLFDVLAKESGPDVGFEFDVFWIVWGGGDPVRLMSAHAGRVWSTHLKDMARDVAPGTPGQDMAKANVVLGTGRIDVRGVCAAGPKAGVEIHYLEDESAEPLVQIPKSAAFYESL
jgi:sugar phosphate isomerase/epimerase